MDDAKRDIENVCVDAPSLGGLLLHSKVIALAVIRQGRIVFANPAFHATFKADGDLTGVALTDLMADADRDALTEALASAEEAPRHYHGMGRRAADAPFDVELCLENAVLDGESAVIAFAWDVTEQHRSREQLAFLAYRDPLTGLANRALFADCLNHSALFARRHGTMFAVLVMDLDGFKSVNDTHGHDVGDIVLQLVGQRFHDCVREEDTLARIGGDEFALLLPRLSDHRVAALVAQRMIDALQSPLDFGAQAVTIGTSIGIAVWPEHAGSIEAMLVAADMAMYQAKRSGKNRFQWASEPSGAEIVSVPPMIWSAAHAIGITEIDDQHAHLADLIEKLSAALLDGLDKDAIQTSLDKLIQFTKFHFGTEERLMEQHQVDGLQVHRQEHRRLLHDIRDLQVDQDLASVSLILRYLHEWLLRHVDGMDRQLGQALVAKGCR